MLYTILWDKSQYFGSHTWHIYLLCNIVIYNTFEELATEKRFTVDRLNKILMVNFWS